MSDPREPLDYQRPKTPGEPRTGRNFGLGLLIGATASSLPWAVLYASGRGDILLFMLGGLVIGKLAVAMVFARTHRYPGFGPGLLVSLGVALLIFGGICFYGLRNI